MKENKPDTAAGRPAKQTRAEKKRAQKATQAQQLALEKQLVKEGKILPRTRYTPKGYLGRILALLLAFLFGMLAVVGGLLGGGYFLAVTPSRNLLNFLKLNEGLLTEEYLDKSVIDIVTDVRNDINSLTEPQNISLSTFSKYSPVVDTMVDSIVEQVSAYGISVDKTTLSTTPLGGLAFYLMDDVIMTAQLGAMLSVNAESEPFMIALCYGTEGSNEEGGDYQIVDGQIVMNEGKEARTLGALVSEANTIINSMPLESILDAGIDSAAVILALCYGTEGVNYTVDENGGITMLTDPLTGKPYPVRKVEDLTGNSDLIQNVTIGDVITIDENTTGILLAIKDWTLNDLSDASRIESLRLSQVVTIDENSAPILKAMQDWRISDMTDADMVDSLTLGQIIEITKDSAQLLKSIADTPIGDLSATIDTLRLCDILDKEAIEGNKILRNLKMSSLDTLADDIQDLTVAQVFGDELYSYLDMSDKGTNGKTYSELIGGYKHLYNTNSAGGDTLRPEAIRADDLAVNETRITTETTDDADIVHTVLEGYFRKDGLDEESAPLSSVIGSEDVYRRLIETTTGEGDDAVTTVETQYYVKDTVEIIPNPDAYEWKYIDYANGGEATALPDNTSVLAEADVPAEYTKLDPEQGTERYYTENGGEKTYYYFCTERIHIRDGEPQTERVAYPLCTDSRGVYVYRYVLEETQLEDGSIVYAENSVRERVDLERTVTQYIYKDGGAHVVFATKEIEGEEGPVSVPDYAYVVWGEGEDAQTVRFMHRAAYERQKTNPETDEPVFDEDNNPVMEEVPERWWIVVESDVQPKYYYKSGTDPENPTEATFVEEEKTQLTWTATWTPTEEDGTAGQRRAVDRYLSGVWYLLFGCEICPGTAESGCTHGTGDGPEGSQHIIDGLDNTNMPILDIASVVTNTSSTIKTLPLWMLWLHEFIDENPFADLPYDYELKGENNMTIATMQNFNEFSINNMMSYIKEILDKIPPTGG